MRRFILCLIAAPLAAQQPSRQTESDEYTRYELLAPGSSKFRISYEVTATTPGATAYFNSIRMGSTASDERVIDRASGQPLVFAEVGAAEARAGGVRVNNENQRYIKATLARPVPANGGEQRLLILKTYEDTMSYRVRGDTIVFTRPLGIKRNAVVLPAGYELVHATFPAQVLQEPDGRVGIAFWNSTPSEAAVTIRAVKLRAALAAAPRRLEALAERLSDRAHQNREIVYFLQQPETNAFDLYHDYTESRPGVSTYVNVVRAGSTVSKPSAVNLDTGEPIPWEVLKGEAITRAGLGVSNVTPQTEAVVFRFPAIQSGTSLRLRISETYTDTVRYKLVDGELVWDRAFGRPSNIVVLPLGWVLTNSSVPCTVSTRPDGRVQLDFINGRNDEIATLITARRR
ncbi:MAG: hypothetical protein FJ363_09605 [Gemmatimonadetes bacterium]|nr:hypothetical protein [Gemmatimonadota bacterium]